jgi:hypothetical protein
MINFTSTMGAPMKHSLVVAVSGIILLSVLALTACTAGKTDQIRISYVPPTNPTHQPIYELLKQRKSLEKLQEFLSPYRLEWILNITLAGCDGEADAMYSDDTITICYEYIEELQTSMPENTTPAGLEPVDTLLGPFIDTVLHEFAHALFDFADIPVLGREEDAADQVAAYIYLQLGKQEAHRLITGTVYTYLKEVERTEAPSMADFAAEHSTPAQRAFNLICMAYGADPEVFADLPALGGLPQDRADYCREEYELIELAYDALISLHVDPGLAEKVFDRSWLPEGTSRLLSRKH